jgi:hypothetical protein
MSGNLRLPCACWLVLAALLHHEPAAAARAPADASMDDLTCRVVVPPHAPSHATPHAPSHATPHAPSHAGSTSPADGDAIAGAGAGDGAGDDGSLIDVMFVTTPATGAAAMGAQLATR